MKLGLLVTRDDFKDDVIGLTKAAIARGHEVIIFMTDDGVRLCLDRDIEALKDLLGVSMSLCDHSAKLRDVPGENVPQGIIAGSQYQNAAMNQDADKVIVI